MADLKLQSGEYAGERSQVRILQTQGPTMVKALVIS
jgi:hypothetical protein